MSKKQPKKQIGVKFDQALIEALDKEAARRNRTRTNLMETILKKELDLI
jgi:predicted transcriptional regulator